ncbi:hypothetical protein [Zeaxanthinibacter enoshimensis]|uniref:Lipoprotein n=1 Tax=Zeaxanthinibacter enoshimensis TaxID=392009 RepID=A0A4R6TM27_9FLAO|nr:hypothetical protein [Zeaxanthinibacter enoshimensis]TDQ31602.1 hypothetical protein CLV82_2311 [Zeaxanthinibacter enoshimensis]
MKKSVLFGIAIMALVACGGVKKTQEALNSGNYHHAMNRAIQNLAENKTKKGHQDYILLLEEAFRKNADRELRQINLLQKDGNPANYETIYKRLLGLNQVQERIRPLLPLYIQDEGRDAEFQFRNYDERILASKDKLSEYLYANASRLMEEATHKMDFRVAYDDFAYLEEINPGYRDCRLKMDEAHALGINYVKVQIANESQQIIPERLEEELLNFNTYGINDFWTQYHTNPLEDVDYNYEMQVAFRDILVTPEQIREKEFVKEKQIKDGYTYLEDENGELVKDSLGNEIKIDRMKTVQCRFYQFTQHKAAQVTGQVSYIDLNTRQAVNSYPLTTEFIFEHIYADYDGDKRALGTDLLPLINVRAVPFPTNEQMVYDAGEDLKLRLKDIISRQQFN